MKKHALVIFVILLRVQCVYAQLPPALEWQRALGGSLKDDAYDVRQTADGGYVLAGEVGSNDGDVTVNHGSTDAWVIKLDTTGTITWEKALGGSDIEIAYAVQQTNDGGFVVAGTTTSNDGDVTGNHGDYDAWVVKLDDLGNITWQRTLGGTDSDQALAIQETTDNGYVLVGKTTSDDGDVTGNHGSNDVWVVKLNDVGNITWQKTLGGTFSDIAYAVQQTMDGGYVIAGKTISQDGDVMGNHGYSDAWVVKLDAMGSILWQKAIGGSDDDNAYAVQETSTGYVFAGSTKSNDGDVIGNNGYWDAWVVKLDPMGNIIWQKALGGSDWDNAYAVMETTDGGYVVAGKTRSNDGDVIGHNGDHDVWVVKLNDQGNVTWQRVLGGSAWDSANAVVQTTDGGYVMTGRTDSNDGDVTGYHGTKDGWVIKLHKRDVVDGVEEQTLGLLQVQPNPSTDLVHISYSRWATEAQITLTDALGREVLGGPMTGSSMTLDLTLWPRGLYLLTLRSTQGVISRRLLLE